MNIVIRVNGSIHEQREGEAVPRVGDKVFLIDYAGPDGQRYNTPRNAAFAVSDVTWFSGHVEVEIHTGR